MTLAEWHSTLFQFIGIVLSFLALVASIIAVILTYKNLSEMKKQLCEKQKQYLDQNRGNLIFYVQKSITGITHDLIIKNFGNSPAKLLSLKITHDLDWKKAGQSNIDDFNISKLNNISELFLIFQTSMKPSWMLKFVTLLAVKPLQNNTK